ncbi:neutral zinc metallopeptidase [Nocardiopsis chromatogenes]|uniref:neutral zinc metallopeptidase n=1 Tax=Nocardiopsis chromatogenes TaxID=280239 RepID=UPI0003600959|nr:neutral zinc metallopeptidase [Nocardiopsis chromatogenes]
MAARGTRFARAGRAGGAGAPSPLPDRPPRPPMGPAVGLVLLTGLTAVGLAGFLTVSELAAPAGAAQARPASAQEASAGTGSGSVSGSGGAVGDPLRATGEMTEVECPAPEVDPEDRESMEAFLHEITDCLDTAWKERFAEGGMDFEPPSRVFWYASGQSPCGNFPAEGTAAFYCQANKGLYLGVEDIVADSWDGGHPETYTFVLGHEYAHHVQGEAGILARFHADRSAASSAAERDRLTRRSELQANCLGGTFLGAVETSLPVGDEEREHILEDARRRGDYDSADRTHGTGENGALWTEHGMDRRDPAACDTWSADGDLVE